ncbi:MAG TPA: hypothetical protein VH370_06170 [Humisphaera sp.]|jgi:hypothetical protein|nr:hypothetical protein [Humisphaera sp.]
MSIDKRKLAAARYQPTNVRLLLIAEAPPCTADRYFFFDEVDQHDWLFRYVWEGLTGAKPDRSKKAEHLCMLRDSGMFIIDLHEDSIAAPSLRVLEQNVPGLLDRCKVIDPHHIILIKSSVYDAAFDALAKAGLPVIDQRIPFPSSGQQRKFLETFRKAIAIAGFALADRI